MSTKTNEPTAAQAKLLATIRKLTDLKGYAPTISELCVESGWHSQNAAAQHLKSLRAKGLVTWETNCSRTIRIVEVPHELG